MNPFEASVRPPSTIIAMTTRTTRVRRLLGNGSLEVGLAALLFLMWLVGMRAGDPVLALPVSFVTCLGLAVAAWHPRTGVLLTCLGLAGQLFLLPDAAISFPLYAPLIVVLSCVSRSQFWEAALTSAWGYAVSVWMSLRNTTTTGQAAQAVLLWLGVYALPWLIGWARRSAVLSERHELEGRAEALRREIAAELHDNVTHDLSAIVTQATAAQMALTRGDPAADPARALADIATRGSRTATYLHNLMALMRVGEPSSAAASFSRELQSGNERLATAGFGLEIYTDGDVDAIAPAISDALGRITREALNNIEHHGDPCEPAEASVSASDRRIAVAFRNATTAPYREDGLGVVGMRERAEAIGGTLETRLSDGYWSVEVSVPVVGRIT